MALSHSRIRFAQILFSDPVNPARHGFHSLKKCLSNNAARYLHPSESKAMILTCDRLAMAPTGYVFITKTAGCA